LIYAGIISSRSAAVFRLAADGRIHCQGQPSPKPAAGNPDFWIYRGAGFGKVSAMRIFQLLLPAALLAAPLLAATEPAAPAAPAASVQFHDDPVDTSSPRATMRSFYTAMQDYKKGLDTGDEKLKERINDAIRCFDLSQLPAVGRRLAATQAAIYLKEIIDRSTVIDYGKLPDSPVNWKSRTGTFVIRQKIGRASCRERVSSPV
jgi:hypothetical protein